MKLLGRLLKASVLVLGLALFGCGDNDSGGSTTTSLAGEATFPAVVAGPAKVAQATKAAANLTLEIRDLNGILVGAPLPLTLKSGTTDTYTYPAASVSRDKDYILTAVRGSQVLRALLDRASLTGATVSKNLDRVSTTAVILAEQKLSLPIGTFGSGALPAGSDPTTLSSSLAGALKPATLEKDLSDALSASAPGAAGVSALQTQLASLLNAVNEVLKKNVDPADYLKGNSTTTITYTTYTVHNGTVQGTQTTSTSITTLLGNVASSYTGPSTGGSTGTSYTISGKVTTAGGIGVSGVTVSTSGAATATTTTAADGSYTLAGVQNGSYTLSASKSGQTFGPSSLTVVVNNANATGQDFIALVEMTAVLRGDQFFTFATGVIPGGVPSEIMYDDVEGGLILPHAVALSTTQGYADIVRAPYGIYRDSNEPGPPTFPAAAGTVYVFRSKDMLGMEPPTYYKLEIVGATKRPNVGSTDYGTVTFRYAQILPPDTLDVFGEWAFPNGAHLSVLLSGFMDYTPAGGGTMYVLNPLSYTGRTTLGGRFITWSPATLSGTVAVTISLTADGKLNATLTGDAPLGTVTLSGGTKQP